MAAATRIAITYLEEIIVEVTDDYQSYWISLEQFKENENLYTLDRDTEKQLNYIKRAKKCSFLSEPDKKCENNSLCGYYSWS